MGHQGGSPPILLLEKVEDKRREECFESSLQPLQGLVIPGSKKREGWGIASLRSLMCFLLGKIPFFWGDLINHLLYHILKTS